MTLLAVFADDFTGALDAGIQFTKAGFSTDILLWTEYADLKESQAAALSDVIVIDTESRHLESAEAFNRLLKLAKLALSQGTSYFYKKTDSTLRGQTGAEMQAMMLGIGQHQVHFTPAYPDMNRLTIKGVQYVDGKQLAQSPYANDPLNPVTSSYIPEILAVQGLNTVKLATLAHTNQTGADLTGAVTIHHETAAVGQTGPCQSENTMVYLYNASSRDDLEAISLYLKNSQKLRLTAGCAGFAEFLAKRLQEIALETEGRENQNRFKDCRSDCEPGMKVPGHTKQSKTAGRLRQHAGSHGAVLLLCGSANQSSLRQLEIFAEGKPKTTFHVLSRKEKHPAYWSSVTGRKQLSDIKQTLRQEGLYVIQTVRKREELDETIRADDTAGSLGTLAANLTAQMPDLNLIVFGGDTVYALMSALRGSALHPLDEISPGVVSSCLQFGTSARLMVTKAGGLGDDKVIEKILAYMATADRPEV